MELVLTFFLTIMLLVTLYQDVKRRTIHVVLPIVVFCVSIMINYESEVLDFYNMLYNIAFVLINVIGLTVYYSFKEKTVVNPIDTFIGLGDIAFFMALTPLFDLKSFILFFILGLLFSLVIHGVSLLFKKIKTIPLAGYLALFLMINMVVKSMFKVTTLY